MVSVLDLMTLCLDLANFGSAEANPADSSIYVLSIPWKSNFLFKGVVVFSDTSAATSQLFESEDAANLKLKLSENKAVIVEGLCKDL